MGSAEADAELIHHAIKGLGTDDHVLVDVLGNRTRAQREQLAAAYNAKYAHSIVHDIKGDTSFNYKDLLVGLVTPLPEYIAHLIHHAIAGLGTWEWILIDVIATTPKPLLDMAAVFYAEKYKSNLREDVKDDTSGNFRKGLLALIDGSKDFFSPPNLVTAQTDAEELHRKGEGRLGTDDEHFVHFFTTASPYHIFEVEKAYHARYNHGLIHAIKNETSGDYQNLLIALATPAVVYWARRAHHSIAGLGTNDTLLQRIFILNDKDALRQIAQAFQQEYGKDFATEVKDDTSGWYSKLLMALLK